MSYSWPSDRPKIDLEACPAKSLADAFKWPQVVKTNLKEILRNIGPSQGTPLVGSGQCLTTSSFFSGVCTQTRAAMVLEANAMGVSFQHARGSFLLNVTLTALVFFVTWDLHTRILFFLANLNLRQASARDRGKNRTPLPRITLTPVPLKMHGGSWTQHRKLRWIS